MITKYTPFKNIPPGEFIKEELEERDWSQEDLAEVMGVSPKTVSKLINNLQAITPEIARLLSKAFDQPLNYWLNLYNNYILRELEKKNNTNEVTKKSYIYSHMPVREIVKKKWIKLCGDVEELENEVLKFFNWEKLNFDLYKEHLPLFRKSEAYSQYNEYNALVWYSMAKKMAKHYNKINPYNKDTLLSLSKELHKFTISSNGVKEFIQCLNDAGVIFFVLSHLNKTYIDGASFYDNENPVIVYSKRYDRIDNFWFVIAHEISHIIKNLEKKEDYYSINFDLNKVPRQKEIEKEADEFALEVVKEKEIIEFFKDKTYKTHHSILEAEKKLQICAGIIVGILQHTGLTSRKNFNEYKYKINDLIPDEYYAEKLLK